jgi:Enolase C-terminal domain-like
MLNSAGLSAALRAELLHAICREAVIETLFAATAREPIAERLHRMRPTECRCLVNQMSDWCGVDAAAQWWQDRQFVSFDDPRAALGLSEDRLAIALHLQPKPDAAIASAHPI